VAVVEKVFSIYRSSAGSGKTRTLAKEYLKLSLGHRNDYFKYILAVTFTNKATQEMKDRILAYLADFSNGKINDLTLELQRELRLDSNTFQMYAQETLSLILHKYDQFSISTIDAFFQKVIRSFTREAGLVGDYRLEVEQGPVMEEVIDSLIDELGNNEDLTKWVVEFANENLENERAWDIRKSLIEFSEEIFREEFKEIELAVNETTAKRDFFKNLLVELRKKKFEFVNLVKSKSLQALEDFHRVGLTGADFKYAAGGVYGYFQKLSTFTKVSDFSEKEKGKRGENEYQNSSNWPAKETPHKVVITKLANDKLIGLLNEILTYRNKNYKAALSAEMVLNNFYAFGLIADISRKLKDYKDENGIMLLADAPRFLNGVIQDSDTPFIYEKVGSFYRNYLIDEFQDTSGLQWKNFFPLLTNGLDQGHPSMVVGDVKQAVYRWRGGDLELLQKEVENNIGAQRVETKELKQNFRSASEIVSFNNALFATSPALVALETGKSITKEAYIDVSQVIHKKETGFVQVSFLKEEGEKWKELALNQLPEHLERLQLLGASPKDIAILVRTNGEGHSIVAHLMNYRNSSEAKPNCKYDVVSNESLRLDGATTVNLLISSLNYLLNHDDQIAKAQLAYEFMKLHEPEKNLNEVFTVARDVTFENDLPLEFTNQKISLKKLPLFELTETLIEIFELGNYTGELTYLQTFQNLVLDFSSRERNDLGAFLEWWEQNKSKKSIQVSGEVDAIQVLTVHKSKGLQFKFVIIPFCSWSLDHEVGKQPNLWVTTSESPLDKAGYLPVTYKSALKETLFAEWYEEERSRCYLDNLNLLYVALTRAEHGMIVMAPGKKGKTVANLLHDSITRSEVLQPKWNETLQVWKSGEWTVTEMSDQSEQKPSLTLDSYRSTQWRDKLVIKQNSRGYFEPAAEVIVKVKYGIHLHAILSRIKYADQLQDTIQQLIFDGLVTEDEKPTIVKLVEELLSNPLIASWFVRLWDVRTEVPILLPGALENRIDRLMLADGKAVIVDFKTGEPKAEDQKQVAEYMDTLKKMDFTHVDGYLLYIKTGDVISVPPGRVTKTKKKDEKQLGLDF